MFTSNPVRLHLVALSTRMALLLRTAVSSVQTQLAARMAGLILFGMGAGLLAVLPAQAVLAQDPVVPPSVEEEDVRVERGRDIVQIPSLWYQEGAKPPDSLGVLRVALRPDDPDAIEYPDVRLRFPVNLQFATFVRNGQVAEIPIRDAVLRGDTPGRVIIRPPSADYYDVAEPYGVTPTKQVPGEETIIDIKTWYEASLWSPLTGERAPADRFHVTRELRGRLRSTATGGETVQFIIPARRVSSPDSAVTFVPPIPPVAPYPFMSQVQLYLDRGPDPTLDWTTTIALLGGPNRADIPGGAGDYRATRIKGDAVSTLRWHPNRQESYELTLYGSTQATFGTGGHGDHNDVPYGVSVSARFGEDLGLEVRADAVFEDDPFQAQTFSTGDERLRLLLGVDSRSSAPPLAKTRWRLSVGPTYYFDRPSSWEGGRSDARELGVSFDGHLHRRFELSGRPTTLHISARADQSWGYIRDARNTNTTLEGRMSLKPNFRLGSARIAVGPVGYVQSIDNDYADIPGFSEFNLQFGLEGTTRVFF